MKINRLFTIIAVPVVIFGLVVIQLLNSIRTDVDIELYVVSKRIRMSETDVNKIKIKHLSSWNGTTNPNITTDSSVDDRRSSYVVREEEELNFSENNTLCNYSSQLFPGSLVGIKFPVWKPSSCRLKYYTPKFIEECFTNKKIVAMGDSLLRSITFELPVSGKKIHGSGWHRAIDFKTSYSLQDTGLQYYGMASFNKHMDKDTSHFHTTETLEKDISSADSLVLSAGTWDMGRDFDGIWEFYRRVSRRLYRLNLLKKSSAEIIIVPPHWIHFDRCVKLCRTCNTPKKVSLFREVVRMAASCQNVSYIDFSKITQRYEHLSRDITSDGLHYYREYADIEADILLNTICRSPPLAPLEPVKCQPEEYLRKMWQHDPSGVFGCHGKSLREIRREKRTKLARQRFMKEVLPFT